MTSRTYNGVKPWDVETWFYENRRGVDPDYTSAITQIRWMRNGDYRPLAAAIRADKVDKAVLHTLAEQIEAGRLKLLRRKGEKRRNPEVGARNIYAALIYENAPGNAAIAKIADAFGISEQSVRQAVTGMRNGDRKWRQLR
jgi:hypothetical protein